MNIAEKLRKLREEKGLSQDQLIDELYKEQGEKIAISSVRNYENEKSPRVPQGTILLALARFYNVSVEYLLDDNISAKSINNVSISRELGLSDESIETIKRLKNKFDHFLDIFFSSDEGYYFFYDLFLKVHSEINVGDAFEVFLVDNLIDQEYEKDNKNKTKKSILKNIEMFNERLDRLSNSVDKYFLYNQDYALPTQVIQLAKNSNIKSLIDNGKKIISEINEQSSKMNIKSINQKYNDLLNVFSEIIDNLRLFKTIIVSIYRDDVSRLDKIFD